LFCLIVIGIFGVLSTLGHLVVDQIRAAWHAGSGRKGILLCAFGIGTAIALIFLTSVANPTLATSINTGWTASWQVLDSVVGTKMATAGLAQAHLTDGFAGLMISSVHEFAFQNLTATNAPLYDTFLLLTVLCISYIGIMRGLFSTVLDSEEFSSIVFVPYEYFAIFGGLIVQV